MGLPCIFEMYLLLVGVSVRDPLERDVCVPGTLTCNGIDCGVGGERDGGRSGRVTAAREKELSFRLRAAKFATNMDDAVTRSFDVRRTKKRDANGPSGQTWRRERDANE